MILKKYLDVLSDTESLIISVKNKSFGKISKDLKTDKSFYKILNLQVKYIELSDDNRNQIFYLEWRI